jgi:hypothetical protein
MPTRTKGDYQIGYGKPQRGCGFKKGESGNPRGRPPGSRNLTTLLNDALNETVTITENGRRRRITKREAVIKQLVNKSASAEARSLKILLDLMLNLEARARSSAARPPRSSVRMTRRCWPSSRRVSRVRSATRWPPRNDAATRPSPPRREPGRNCHDEAHLAYPVIPAQAAPGF